MQPFGKIDAYVCVVLEQIRWKKARPQIQEEIKNHVIDQRDAFMAQGLDESAATEKAVAETGDAADIGLRLDRIHRPKPQWAMLALTAALLLIGLVIHQFIFGGASRALLSRQLLFTALAVVVLVVAYFSDFTLIGKYPVIAYLSAVTAALAAILLSPMANGRPLHAPYMLMLFPLAFAAVLFHCRNKRYMGILLCAAAFTVLAVIALLVPSISGCFHYIVACAVVYCVAVAKNWFGIRRSHALLFMLVPIAAAVLTFALIISQYPHMQERLAVAFDPLRDPIGAGYMGVMARELLGGAKWFGAGTVPEPYGEIFSVSPTLFQTDFLLTGVTARLGWVASAIIALALLFFIVKGFLLCFKQKGGLGLFVSVAVMMTFAMQVVSYVTINFGITLLSPLSLPFISYGNTAMLINAGLVGFMLSVFRTGHIILIRTKTIP